MRKQYIAYLGIAAASLTFLYRQNSDSIHSLANGFAQHYLSGKHFSQSSFPLPKFPFDPSYVKDYPSITYKPKNKGIDGLLNEAMNKVSDSQDEIKTRDKIYVALLNGNILEAERIAGSHKDWYGQESIRAENRTKKFLYSIEEYEKQISPMKGVSAFDIVSFLIEKKDMNNARIPELLENILETMKHSNLTFGAIDFSILYALNGSSSRIVQSYLGDINRHFLVNYSHYANTSLEIIKKGQTLLILGDNELPKHLTRVISPVINNINNNLKILKGSGLYAKEGLADIVLAYYWDSYRDFESYSDYYINGYLYPEINGNDWLIRIEMAEYPDELGLADLLTIGMWAEEIQPGITSPIHFKLQQISSLEKLAKINTERSLLFNALMIMARRGNLQIGR